MLRQLETALRFLACFLLALQLLDLLLLLLLALFDASAAGSGEVVLALRRLLAALLRQLDRGLHRLAVVLRAVQVLAREDFRNLARGDALEDCLQVRAAQRLLLEQLLRQGVQVVPVLAQDLVGDVLGLVHEHANVLVHQRGDLLGGVELATAAAADERVALLLTELHGTHARAHAVLDDHGLGDLRGHLDVRARAGGRVAEDQLLGGAAAHRKDEASEKLGAVVHALVVFRGGHRVPAGAAAGQDGDLINPLDILHRPGRQGVATLVVGGDLLLVLGDDLRGTARATHYAVGGFLQGVAGDDVAVHARGQQRGLVEDVLQVRAGHAGGALGQGGQVDVRCQRLTLRVDAQDLFAADQVRVGDRDLAVEAARAQECWVEHVRAVRRGHEDHALAAVEAIHLHEQLVQGLLALIVAAAHAGASLAADGVDLVDEDDAGRVLLRLLEQVAHAGGTDTDEHFHEVGAGDAVERHPGLTGHCAGQQRLTGAGRAVEQHAAWDLRAELFVLTWVGEEVPDLVELLDGLVRTGDVVEAGIRVVLLQVLGAGLAEAEGAHAPAALHAGEHEEQQAEDQQHRQEHHQHAAEEGILRDVGVEFLRLGALHRVEDLLAGPGRVLGGDLLDPILALDLDRLLQLQLYRLFAVLDLGFLDVLGVELLDRDGGIDLVETTVAVREHAKSVNSDEGGGDDPRDPQDLVLVHISHQLVVPAQCFPSAMVWPALLADEQALGEGAWTLYS